MSRYTDFTDLAVEAAELRSPGKVTQDWRHRLVDPSGTIVASTDETDGAIEWGAELRPLLVDRRGASQRLAQLRVPGTDLDLIPDEAGPLHPDSGYRVEIEAGLVVDGSTTWQRQATMLVEDLTASDSGAVDMTVNLVDTTRPLLTNMVTGLQFAQGALVTTLLDRLFGQVLDSYQIAPSTHTLPLGSIGAGDPRGRYVFELLAGIGHELTTTPEGLVITRPILPSTDDDSVEFWRYGQQDGIVVDKAVRGWTSRTPQGWRVEGGSFSDGRPPITITVWDTDPSSAGHYTGQSDVQIQTLRAPWITTLPQGAVAGYGQLRKYGRGPAEVTIESVPNPGIRQGDIVELYRPDIRANGRYRVMDYTLPLQVDGPMTMLLRKVYDPERNFVPPDERPDGCQPVYAAPFADLSQYPGPNLDNNPAGGAGGNASWSEHGVSWNIRDGVATELFPDTWCLAFVNQPVCSSNQFASIVIPSSNGVPSGRAVGPWVRSSGQFDGYGLIFREASQTLSLERWLNGQRVVVLDQMPWSSVDGQEMALEANGTSIVGVVVGTSASLSATDDEATGTFVGMIGYGGAHPNGPKVASFSAGSAGTGPI